MNDNLMIGADLLLKPRWDYRVIEIGFGDDAFMSIRRVDYDRDSKPVRCHHVSPQLTHHTGDGLVALLNDLAMALTKPSLLESEFVRADD